MSSSAGTPRSLAEQQGILLVRAEGGASVPPWLRRFSPQRVGGDELRSLDWLRELTVVQAGPPAAVLRRKDFLRALASRHARTPRPAKILFVFSATSQAPDAEKLSNLLLFFERPGDVEFARGAGQASFALQEAFAKLRVSHLRREQEEAGRDPLGSLSNVIAATADLRAASGRHSAKKVAQRFGMTVAELAGLLGRSRQAVSKTDDAQSLQDGLRPFERIARLRAVLSERDFLSWLNLASDELEGKSPLAAIRAGQAPLVAELVEDMLSGSPG